MIKKSKFKSPMNEQETLWRNITKWDNYSNCNLGRETSPCYTGNIFDIRPLCGKKILAVAAGPAGNIPPPSSRGVAPRHCRRIEHKSVTTDALRSFKQRWDVADTTAPKQATLTKLLCAIQFICFSENDYPVKCTPGIKCVINVLFCVSGNPGLSCAQTWKQLARINWCCSP